MDKENMPFHPQLIGELIGLARCTDGNEHLISESSTLVVRSVLAAANAEIQDPQLWLRKITREKRKMVPDCFLCAAPCGKNHAFDMNQLNEDSESVYQKKCTLLQKICQLASSSNQNAQADLILYQSLVLIGVIGISEEILCEYIQKVDHMLQSNS